MLDSVKLCLISQQRRARKILEKLNLSKKLRSCRKGRTKLTFDSTWFATMEASSQLKQVFKFIDTNDDGKLSPLELKKVLLSLGDEKAEAAAKEAEGIVREMDCNGDGFVDLDEFMIVMENDQTEDSGKGVSRESVIMEAFRVFDADNNGLISAEELQRVLGRLGCGNCSVKECRKMIKGVDRDGDGFVNFEEFKDMMSAGY